MLCSGQLHIQSFEVLIEEISEIKKIDSDSGPPAYYLCTSSSEQHYLNGNFGIPSHRIVEAIRRMRPEVPLLTA